MIVTEFYDNHRIITITSEINHVGVYLTNEKAFHTELGVVSKYLGDIES